MSTFKKYMEIIQELNMTQDVKEALAVKKTDRYLGKTSEKVEKNEKDFDLNKVISDLCNNNHSLLMNILTAYTAKNKLSANIMNVDDVLFYISRILKTQNLHQDYRQRIAGIAILLSKKMLEKLKKFNYEEELNSIKKEIVKDENKIEELTDDIERTNLNSKTALLILKSYKNEKFNLSSIQSVK